MKIEHTGWKGWTPVRVGDLYCSPRCKGKCTYEDYLRACDAGESLAKRMGDGWEPAVWESLGWHFRITKGIAHIEGRDELYTVYINTEPRIVENGKTPEKAMQAALNEATAIKERMAEIIGTFEPK